MTKILVLNGANLNLLGKREPSIYGFESLTTLESNLRSEFPAQEFDFRQTNSEDELIGFIHQAFEAKLPAILNPGAFTHYSYALRDACAALTSSGVKLIEVHITNPHTREQFRHTSVVSGVATGVIAGFGLDSYRLAVSALTHN